MRGVVQQPEHGGGSQELLNLNPASKPTPSVILSKSLNLLPSVPQSRTGIILLTYQTFLLGMFWRLVFAKCFEDEITTRKIQAVHAGPTAAVNSYSSLGQNSP